MILGHQILHMETMGKPDIRKLMGKWSFIRIRIPKKYRKLMEKIGVPLVVHTMDNHSFGMLRCYECMLRCYEYRSGPVYARDFGNLKQPSLCILYVWNIYIRIYQHLANLNDPNADRSSHGAYGIYIFHGLSL